MPNSVKYSTTTPLNSLRKGNVAIGVNDVDMGPTTSTGWYNGVTPSGNYPIIYKTTSTGDPDIFAPQSDQELYNFVIMQGGNSSNTTSIGAALAWIATQSDLLAVNNSLPNISTDGLVLNLDASLVNSYPTTGTTWYDLSGVGANWTVPSSAYSSGVMNYASNQSSLSPPAPWQSTTDLTIEVLYKPNTGGIYTGCCDTIFGRYYFRFFQIGTSLYTMIGFNNGSGGSFYQHPAITVSYDRWHHIVGARRDNRFIIWVDGVERYNTTYGSGYALFNPGETWYLSTSRQTNVDFSTCRIYDKGLSDNEILQNYYQAPIVTDGLVFAVDAGNLVSYENGSTTTNSLIGSDVGTLINGVGFESTNGGSWDFDGTNDYINCGTFSTSYITLSTWVYRTSSTQNQGICRKQSGWAISQYNGTLQVAPGNRWSFYNTGYTIPLNTWVNITYSYGDGFENVYINGEAIWTSPLTGTIPTNGNMVRIGYDDNGWFWGGKISGTLIYNRALTPDEVSQNYNAQSSRFI
jgi:hypothetical protein